MPIPGPSQIVGYDVGTLSPTPPTPKVTRKGNPDPKETNVVSEGTTRKPVSRSQPTLRSTFPHLNYSSAKANLPIDDDLPTKDPDVGVDEGRGHRTTPGEAKEEKDRKDPGVGFELLLTKSFSFHRSVNRAGRTSKPGGDRLTLRWLQRRRSPLRGTAQPFWKYNLIASSDQCFPSHNSGTLYTTPTK